MSLTPGFIHIYIQKRHWHLCRNQDSKNCECKSRKAVTTVTGMSRDLDLKKILKHIKKVSCCNGTVLQDPDTGNLAMQFQGDQREQVRHFLLAEDICDRNSMKIFDLVNQ